MPMTKILKDFLVAEFADGVAGQYVGKMLADAGADVVKVEPEGGCALRGWSVANVPGMKAEAGDKAGATSEAETQNRIEQSQDGAFFQYLNTGKRSLVGAAEGTVASSDASAQADNPAVARLLEIADIVIEDNLPQSLLDKLQQQRPEVVVISLSPYGRLSSEADRPATEFTLQARAGGIGKRGRLENPPVQAGGRIGEWMAGVCGAVGGLAAAQRAKATGQGEHVDVSLYEGLVISTNIYAFLLASLSGNWDVQIPHRNLEMPSIEPTADGFVGFSTMAQQQFQDFLRMIGAEDWVDDPVISSPFERWAARDMFFERVHAWTKSRTTEEIVGIASSLRIPVSLIGNGEIVPTFEAFEGRDMFVENPSGGFTQPRRPYLIHGLEMPALEPVPKLGETTAVDIASLAEHKAATEINAGTESDAGAKSDVEAESENELDANPASEPEAKPSASPPLPLEGIRIIECTGWWAGPIAGQTLAQLGADIIKVESTQRPDGMRFASVKPPTEDKWWEWGMVYHGVNTNKRAITLNLTDPEGRAVLEKLVATADVLIENYTPRVMDNFGITWEHLSAINPELIMVRMPGFGLSGPWRDNTGFAQTMEQMSGMAYLTGYPEEPPQIPRGPCDPVAGLHASFATLLALEERRQSGKGKLVEVAMIDAALNVAAEALVEFSSTDILMERVGNSSYGLAPQGVYPCSEHETWVGISAATDQQWQALAQAIGQAGLASDPTLATWQDRWLRRDELDEAISEWSKQHTCEEAAELLLAAGVPASVVEIDRHVGRDALLWERGFFVELEHPVAGAHGYPAVPFRYASRTEPWINRHPPTVGEHNEEVFGELGYSVEDMARLQEQKVIGNRPLFA